MMPKPDLRIQNFISGQFENPVSGEFLDNFEPATGKVYSQVADSGPEDVARAVESATQAFTKWSQTTAAERSRFLRRIAEGIAAKKEQFAQAESVDNGKPIMLSRLMDIPRSIANFEFFADGATQVSTDCHMTDGLALNYTTRSPLGVVGCISPWNLPLYLLSWKIAPALAAGNCVVAKPSEVTPMTAHLLAQVCADVGLPPGVLNIVHGLGTKAGESLTRHGDVSAISFTGSTKTGAEIARMAAPKFKKLSLEMGGKNPSIIFADCDFEKTVAETVRSAFLNQGQICLCGSRIFVEESLYSRFKESFLEKTKQLRVGDPLDATTDQGALVSKTHFEKITGALELAKKEGGKILTGGRRASVEGRCQEGWFFEPTVIEGLDQNCRTNQDEIFGPVVTLTPFKNDDQVVEWANGTRYGLASNIWTQDLTRAHRVAGRLQTGIVWVNCWMLRDLRTPFGGMKESGVGREGGWDAFRFFTEPKNICVKI